jgi:Rod binding domain-containing protein
MNVQIERSLLTTIDTRKTNIDKTTNAATQFEALLIAQMLKNMRESETGWLGTGEDSAADSAMGMAEEHFAAAISAAGGFGMAKLVKTGLETPNLSGTLSVGAKHAR